MPLFLLRFLPLLLKAGPLLKKAGPVLKRNWDKILVAGGIMLLATMIHFKNNKIESLEADKVRYEVFEETMTAANLTNQVTIITLRRTNDEWVELLMVSENVRASAYKAAQDRARRAQVRLDDTRTQLRDLENETQTCADISRIDIGAACPLSVDILRRAATGTFD